MSLVFTPVPSTEAFFVSDNFVSLICGPVGSTKTTAGILKILYHAGRMAPSRDGLRYSRCVWVRQTREQLRDTSIPDFLKWFPDGEAGTFYKSEMKYMLSVGDIRCEVLFRGLDESADVRRLLSLQLSFAVVEEFRELNKDVYEALQARLGRYPDGVVVPHKPEWGNDDKGNPRMGCVMEDGMPNARVWGMSNPPDMDTFFEGVLSNPPSNTHVTIQPSGMSPEADWIHLLPSNYYETLAVGKSQDYIDVYIHAKFGKSLSGQPVFRCFDRATHVAKEAIKSNASTLVIGVDAGLNPTAVITELSYDGRLLVLDAVTGLEGGMGALRFCREILKPLLGEKYPHRAVAVVIDPAAFQRAQTDERSVADIFKQEGFSVKPAHTNALAARLGAVEKYLTMTVNGSAGMLIDPGARGLVGALAGKYRYKINTKGETDDKPEKNHPWSDYCFPAGEQVKTPSGYVAIDSLKVGDEIVSYEGVEKVIATGSRVADRYVRLTLSDEREIVCTPDHPFAVGDHTCYLPADALNCTHVLVDMDAKLPLTVVKKDYLSGGAVYNLTTSKTNTFVVNGVLVHNCDALQYAALHHDKGSIFGRLMGNSYQTPEKVSMAAWT